MEGKSIYPPPVYNSGICTDILWTPGHANIKGNDIADQLAKEAAQEAASLPTESVLVTQQDIILAARELIRHRWQKRWDTSNTGRTLYDHKPLISEKTFLDEPSPSTYKIIMQLRTGYSCLNNHLHTINPLHSRLCNCGEPETVNHLLCECTLYEEDRAVMSHALGKEIGLRHLDSQTLLEYADDDNIPGWRKTIIQKLGNFLVNTRRFVKETYLSRDKKST